LLLVTAILVLAIVELYTAMRRSGYRPANLVGIAVTVCLPLAAYANGDVSYPLVLFIAVTFGLLWYLVGAGGDDSIILGLSSTFFGIGLRGGARVVAALILSLPNGIGVLYGAIFATVGYDVLGFFSGAASGRVRSRRPARTDRRRPRRRRARCGASASWSAG